MVLSSKKYIFNNGIYKIKKKLIHKTLFKFCFLFFFLIWFDCMLDILWYDEKLKIYQKSYESLTKFYFSLYFRNYFLVFHKLLCFQ